MGWHPSSRARIASRLDATTTRRIAQSDGTRLGVRCLAARLFARWHQRSRCLEREQGTDQSHNCSVDRVSPGALSLYFEWTNASRCHRSAQTGGFPAAARAGTCKAMIEQGWGRASFCSAGRARTPGEDHCFTLSAQDHNSFSHSFLLLFSQKFQIPSFHISSFNISTVSPGTVRADLAHSRGARSTARWVKVAVGGLASLLQWIGRGASRQRLHIISGRKKLRVFRSLAAGIPRVRQAWQPAAGVVVDTVWMVESAARVTLYGGQELATLTIPPGGYGPTVTVRGASSTICGSLSLAASSMQCALMRLSLTGQGQLGVVIA